MRRDWKCDEDNAQRIPDVPKVLQAHRRIMTYSLRRHAGLVSAPPAQNDNPCTPSPIRTRTHSRKVGDPKADIIPRVDPERFAFDLHLVLATLRIWKACVGGDDTTSISIT